jgi:hypothetical protein
MASEKKMKTGFNKLALAATLIAFAAPSYAAGTIIATAILVGASTATITAVAFAINMVIAAVITKAFFTPNQSGGGLSGDSPNPGNRQQLPPATDNKIPVVYGEAYLGGIITDLSISSNNQELYYVIPICEVTNNGADNIQFGDVYFGGKKCVFDPVFEYKVTGLLDESTGQTQTNVNGKLEVYLYRNGSNQPANSAQSAIQVMQTPGLVYQWDGNKLMTNTAFAIVHLTYNNDAGITGIQQTKFQVFNSRFAPGDCFVDYLTNEVYGAAIPLSQIDSNSFQVLNSYCAGSFSYTDADGNPQTQARFRFDGVINTSRSIMDNLQDMASSCDCLIKYNEIFGQWGVITQSPTYTIAMALNDSNMVSAIQITPLDIAASYNVIECKFPDNSNQDAFNSSTFDLAQIDPSLLYPNEPVNKQSVSLQLVNNDVRAQYIATRMLKASREDLQVQVAINFQGIQLEAGDIVTITNANYGWVAKEFRAMKVTEDFESNGAITAKLILTEFTASIYDDTPINEFQPSPNTGIADPLVFGTVPAPVVTANNPTAINPFVTVTITSSTQGIIQYAELWYSAFPNPSTNQLIFGGTTAIQSNGSPYAPNTVMPAINLSQIPDGNYYFFSRMVNSLGTSQFSPASIPFGWKPYTFQFTERYLMVAYADTETGGGFSLTPTNESYFGYVNQDSQTPVTNPSAYTWLPASPSAFGTTNFLLYSNRGSRKFTFGVGQALFASQTGAYVPANTAVYDQSLWSALPTGVNSIDLDQRTGQLLTVGTSSISAADGLIKVTNTQNGLVVAQLEKFLNFGAGIKYKTSAVAQLTIDEYGRVVGFKQPDVFGYTATVFNATSGQTIFPVTHTVGNGLVFQNGMLLDTSEYTENATTYTLTVGADLNDKIVIITMKGTSTDEYYEPLNISVGSSTSTTVTYSTSTSPYQTIVAGDKISFTDIGTPTTYTVQTINTATRVITFTTSISGATAGLPLYRYRAASSTYKPFSRFTANVTDVTGYAPTEWALRTGFELFFINGCAMTALDYNITDGTIGALPDTTTGKLTIIQFNENNLSIPCAGNGNSVITTIEGVTTYGFAHNQLAFELYGNGALFALGYDYTDTDSTYTLSETPNNSYTLLQQQTFERNAAA